MQILRFEEPHVVVLRLSGRVDRLACQQIDLAVNAASLVARGRRLEADLGDVTIGDEAGAKYIRTLPLKGLELTVVPQPIAELLDAAAQAECESGCNRLQRVLFRTAQMGRAAPFAFRKWVCTLLRSVLPPTFVARHLRNSKVCEW